MDSPFSKKREKSLHFENPIPWFVFFRKVAQLEISEKSLSTGKRLLKTDFQPNVLQKF